MTWTKINKPTGPTYTNVNPMGKEQYDQPDIIYDSSTTYYDGVNPNQWTDVSKPLNGPTWAALTVTWASYQNPWGSPSWTLVTKPV